MTDFLDEKRKEIDARLKELRPLVDEYSRLEKAAEALAGVGSESAQRPSRRRASNGRKRSPGTGRRGRPPGSGKRARQAEELVNARPGITIPELAAAMDIQANYLYRVMPTLENEGKISKQGKGWHPGANAPEPSDSAAELSANASPTEA
ncbi:MAG: hypothetical protein H0U32_05520 [Thermoleophilaceae bacterium]|nr:hypothetical protein [Thermoleophilaceae bacterium]